jgi:lipoyl-dependent peroxiredoxin
MPNRTAEAVWNGSLAEGSGHLKSQTGVVDADYDWKSRAEQGGRTNPEELLAAAHAGCFNMALSHALGEAGHEPRRLRTKAHVSFEPGKGITGIRLETEGEVPGIDEATFRQQAEGAKTGCPVSKALSGVPMELEAKLVG